MLSISIHKHIGIIPAAGKATRFGGVMKELLPAPDGKSLLKHAVRRLSFCDEIYVVTSFEKYEHHRRELGDTVNYLPQVGKELWGAMSTVFTQIEGSYYFMTMPDTYTDERPFDDALRLSCWSFGMGLFETYEPHRFGVFEGGSVRDKPLSARVPAKAWGVLAFHTDLCSSWLGAGEENYTAAINHALFLGDYTYWSLQKYYDCGTMEAYTNFLVAEREI